MDIAIVSRQALRSVLCGLLLLPALVASSIAQPNLTFKRAIANWPDIELYYSVGCDGNPDYSATEKDFRIFDNGVEVRDFKLWCPDPTIRCAISVALVFDCAGSLLGSTEVEVADAHARDVFYRMM